MGLTARPVLVADTPEQYAEARLRLARVGIEDPRGILQGGVAAWKQARFSVSTVPQITVQELSRKPSQNLQVLDVRREPEWQAGHIEGAEWFPLDNFKISAPELDPSAPVAVHCQGGYRSMIACSLLQRAGLKNVMNVIGGFDAWRQAALPVEVHTRGSASKVIGPDPCLRPRLLEKSRRLASAQLPDDSFWKMLFTLAALSSSLEIL